MTINIYDGYYVFSITIIGKTYRKRRWYLKLDNRKFNEVALDDH